MIQDRRPDVELLEGFRAAYDLIPEGIEANRRGTISEGQREQYKGTGRKLIYLVLIGAVATVALLTISLPNEGYTLADSFGIGLLLAALFSGFVLPMWWWTCRYPLGKNRVKTMVGPIYLLTELDRHEEQVRFRVFVGEGVGARELPQQHTWIPPMGLMVRLYYNQGFRRTLVHSIELAERGAESSIPARARKAKALIALAGIAFAGLLILGGIEERNDEREFQEQLDNFTTDTDGDGVPDFQEIEPLDQGDLEQLIPPTTNEDVTERIAELEEIQEESAVIIEPG